MLRETAQTLDEDKEALADLSPAPVLLHATTCGSTSCAMRDELDRRDGVLGLRADQEHQDRRPGGLLAARR